MSARKESVLVVYGSAGPGSKHEIPQIAVMRDQESGHFVLYRLEEMNGEDIEKSFNESEKAAALQALSIKKTP